MGQLEDRSNLLQQISKVEFPNLHIVFADLGLFSSFCEPLQSVGQLYPQDLFEQAVILLLRANILATNTAIYITLHRIPSLCFSYKTFLCYRKLYKTQIFIPTAPKILHTCPEHILQDLIGTLCLTIRLRVISCNEVQLGSQFFLHSPPKVGHKSIIFIKHNIHWNPMQSNNLLNIKSSNLFIAYGTFNK